MTARPVPRLDISNLSLAAELGRGGQGLISSVSGILIEGKWPAALKKYSSEILPHIDGDILADLVNFYRELDAADGQWLRESTAWPAILVEDNGSVCGFLMRTVPDPYYFHFRTVTQGGQRKPADLAFLLNPDDYVADAGIAVSERQRVALLRSIAVALSHLHKLDVVVGDFSPKNILFTLSPKPGCFLIDCDAAVLKGASASRQMETPDWEAPSGEAVATPATDAYKFGLLAIRLFARDQSARDAAALAAASPELGQLAERSQLADPQRRPGPADWITSLERFERSASTSQQTTSAWRPNTPVSAWVASPTGQPQPATPAAGLVPTATPPRRRAAPILLSAVGLAVVLLVILIAGHLGGNSAGNNSTTTGNSSSLNQNQGGNGNSSSVQTQVGVVQLGSGVQGDSRATDVGSMFDTYFSGINQQQYTRALSVFDPSGMINPNDASKVQAFSQADSTSTDSNVVLVSINPSGTDPVTSAEVTFQSQQSPGYGPSSNPNETCTNWNITYNLSQDSSGGYLIFNVSTYSHSTC